MAVIDSFVSDTHMPVRMVTMSGVTAADEALPWPTEVRIGEVAYPLGGTLGPRQQRFVELVVVHRGSMTVWVDSTPHHAEAGTISLLLPGHKERFAFAAHERTWHSWMEALFPSPSEAVLARLSRAPRSLPLSPTLAQLMRAGLALPQTHLPTEAAIRRTLAVEMLWWYLGEAEARLPAIPPYAHPAVERARQFIHAHLSTPITLDAIAVAAAVSPTHLVRLFRGQLHTTPMAYVWERRVAQGVALLEGTGLPVHMVAELCGFQTSYHFSRRTRQVRGLSPLDIRRRAWRHE